MLSTKSIKNLSVIHLQLIISLIKHGNATATSEELGISPSSISYHLRYLRDIFGDEMFLRTGNGLKPTERCLQIGRVANDLVSRIESDLINAGDFDPSHINKEILLVGADTITGWFSSLFTEIQQHMPKVMLCARPWYINAIRDLDQGLVHFGVHLMNCEIRGIHEIETAPCYRVCVVREGHPLADKLQLSLEDLAFYPVIMNDLSAWNINGNSPLETVMAQHGLRPNLVAKLSANNIFNVLHNCNAITHTSALALPTDLTGLKLLKAPVDLNLVECFYKFYISKTRYGSQETNHLIEFLHSSFQDFVMRQYQRPEVKAVLPSFYIDSTM